MRTLWVSLLLGAFFSSGQSQVFNQKVPFEISKLVYDTAECFIIDSKVPIVVGEHVTTLDEGFLYCLSDTVYTGYPPIGVMLAIDQSGSMDKNDPENMRIVAALRFVDSLKFKSPSSYVGSIIIDGNSGLSSIYGPVNLSDRSKYDSLVQYIRSGARGPIPVLTKTLATYQGLGIDSALSKLEKFHKLMPSLKLHTILLTDDGWFEPRDVKPPALFAKYRPRFTPANTFPKIHSVVLTLSGDPQGDGVQGLANVKMVADSTGGLYIENATPQTIVSNMMKILEQMSPRMDKLTGVTVKNIVTGESHVMKLDSVSDGGNNFIARGASWNLRSGENIFVFERTLLMRDSTTALLYDTLKLIRSPDILNDTLSAGSHLESKIVMVDLSFTAKPDSLLVSESSISKVQIDPTFVFPYDLTDVVIRGFTTNNPTNNGVMSVFHLDSNTTNSVISGTAGDGSPGFNKYVGAFGGSMNSGSFNAQMQIPTADFSFDFWVYNENNVNKTLVSSSKFTLSMNDAGAVSFVAGAITLRSTTQIYPKVWTNIAVSRFNGVVSVFINGLLASEARAIDFSGSTTLTFNAGTGTSIDEVRLSTLSNVKTSRFGKIYAVSQLDGMSWTLNGTNSRADSVSVGPARWVNNAVDFTFTRNSVAQTIINMTRFDSRMPWSVNSNPVEFSSPWPAPVPVEAVVLDENGNGFIDHIKFSIVNDTSKLIQQMPSVESLFKNLTLETYLGGNTTLRAQTIQRIDDGTFMVTLTENTGANFETGWKSANFATNSVSVFTSGAYVDIIRVIDGAGPVISKAVLYSGTGNDNERLDTIVVSFSEPLKWLQLPSTSPQDVFNYYHFAQKTVDALHGINPTDIKVADDRLSLRVLVSNDYVVQPGEDSLQLKSIVAKVTDEGGVAAHVSSRIAPIEGTPRMKFVTVKVVLYDQNGNGFIDNIEVILPDEHSLASDLPAAEAFFTKHSLETYFGHADLRPAKLQVLDLHTLKIALNENSGSVFETGWTSYAIEIATVPLTTDKRGLVVGEVIDKAGPVIVSADFEYSTEAKKPDIIRIQFSEPISLVKEGTSLPTEMLNYFQQSKLSADALDKINSDALVMNADGRGGILSITNGFMVLPVYDSLQLKNVSDHLVDKSGNSANVQNKVTVINGKAKSIVTIIPSANPYTPGTTIPENIKKYFAEALKDGKEKGVLFAIRTTLPLKKIPGKDTYGDVQLYDCVGNIVGRQFPVLQVTPKDYCFFWDAKNLRNRTVNDGTYLAVVKVTDLNDLQHVFRVKIGVK